MVFSRACEHDSVHSDSQRISRAWSAPTTLFQMPFGNFRLASWRLRRKSSGVEPLQHDEQGHVRQRISLAWPPSPCESEDTGYSQADCSSKSGTLLRHSSPLLSTFHQLYFRRSPEGARQDCAMSITPKVSGGWLHSPATHERCYTMLWS